VWPVRQHGSRRGQESIELGSIDQRAAGDAEHDDVQTKRQTGPEMNLKDRAAEPYTLRLWKTRVRMLMRSAERFRAVYLKPSPGPDDSMTAAH
jgi:hypothetical protein